LQRHCIVRQNEIKKHIHFPTDTHWKGPRNEYNIEDLHTLRPLPLDRRPGDGQARSQESGGARHAESKGREQELHDEDGGVWVLCFGEELEGG
jgi:hypothetical protein